MANVSRVLLLIAIICEVLAAFGVANAGGVGLVPLGLAFAFASQFVPTL